VSLVTTLFWDESEEGTVADDVRGQPPVSRHAHIRETVPTLSPPGSDVKLSRRSVKSVTTASQKAAVTALSEIGRAAVLVGFRRSGASAGLGFSSSLRAGEVQCSPVVTRARLRRRPLES